MKRLLAGTVLLICSAIVYGRGLAGGPMRADERQLATQASKLLARTDDRFRRWKPSFVRVEGDVWLAPVPVYTTAALMTLAPSALVHGRWAAVVFGSADVLLFYALVVQCVWRVDIGFLAGLGLLFTPSHAFFSRTAAAEGIWPLPFILMWALSVAVFIQRPPPRAPWILVAGTISLLASASAQASAALMIPVFAVVTIVVCRRAEGWRTRDVIPASAVAAAALLLSSLLLARGGYADVLSRWFLQRAQHLGEPAGSLRLIAWQWAATVSAWFSSFFLPSHLFLTPEEQGLCGLFLTAMVVPMAAGVYALAGHSLEDEATIVRMRPMIGAACIAGPLTAAIASHPPLDGPALIVVPFGVLLAIQGSMLIWQRGRVVGRIVLVAACVGAAIQATLCFS